MANVRAGATRVAVGAEAGVARGDLCVEYSAHAKAGLLLASGAGAETELLEATSFCTGVRQARDGRAVIKQADTA
jgi:hypothetical protein